MRLIDGISRSTQAKSIIDWVYLGIPKQCIVGYSLTCPIMSNLYSIKLHHSMMHRMNAWSNDHASWSFDHPANSIENSYCFQLLEVCSPLAWLAGEKFSILCRCTSDGFGRMCDAYMKGCLLTDEMLEIHSMSVVDVSGTAGELLNPESRVSHQPCFPLSLLLNVVRV